MQKLIALKNALNFRGYEIAKVALPDLMRELDKYATGETAESAEWKITQRKEEIRLDIKASVIILKIERGRRPMEELVDASDTRLIVWARAREIPTDDATMHKISRSIYRNPLAGVKIIEPLVERTQKDTEDAVEVAAEKDIAFLLVDTVDIPERIGDDEVFVESIVNSLGF